MATAAAGDTVLAAFHSMAEQATTSFAAGSAQCRHAAQQKRPMTDGAFSQLQQGPKLVPPKRTSSPLDGVLSLQQFAQVRAVWAPGVNTSTAGDLTLLPATTGNIISLQEDIRPVSQTRRPAARHITSSCALTSLAHAHSCSTTSGESHLQKLARAPTLRRSCKLFAWVRMCADLSGTKTCRLAIVCLVFCRWTLPPHPPT